jgi:hypothetical protein
MACGSCDSATVGEGVKRFPDLASSPVSAGLLCVCTPAVSFDDRGAVACDFLGSRVSVFK